MAYLELLASQGNDTTSGHDPIVICDNPGDRTRDGSCPECQPWCPTCRTEWPCETAEQEDQT